jgi:hypothetical protein
VDRGKYDRRETLVIENKQIAGTEKRIAAATALALLLTGSAALRLLGQNAPATANMEKKTMTTASKFYCNSQALTSAERTQHQKLTDKLIASRKEIVETEKGYEFRYSPSTISLAELAEWVVAESKCCPFLDFHIGLEREGQLLCLRLTGEEGIKAFIRSEFQVGARS